MGQTRNIVKESTHLSFLLSVKKTRIVLDQLFTKVSKKRKLSGSPLFLAEKMAIILPTGQWYAPSAVSNDALIMPEYARVCQSRLEYGRL